MLILNEFLSFIKEFWNFVKLRKKYWLIPILCVLVLFGALIVGVFSSGLSIAGLDVLWQRFALGCLIIIAVGIDQWIRKVSV